MSQREISEGIYVKQKKGKFGTGATSRESILETYWLPFKTEGGYVELLLVTDNLQSVMGIKERVSLEDFKKNYTLRDDSKNIYDRLIRTV